MIKAALVALLYWVDPTVQVVPASSFCSPMESEKDIESFHEKNMRGFGEGESNIIVDPWGVLSDEEKESFMSNKRNQ